MSRSGTGTTSAPGIDERTLREIYFPAFERAVHEGHVGAVMTSYNLLNGTYASHNEWLIRTVLKQQWGFPGIVMSDWKAVHDATAAYNGGCDLEMPSGEKMNRASLLPLIAEHKLEVATLDDKVRRILRTVIAAGFVDRVQQRDDLPKDDPASAAIALEAARKSIVLLKNTGALLPLDGTKIHRIAVIGPNIDPAVVGGSGSGYITPAHSVSVLAGLQQGAAVATVVHHAGVSQTSEGGSLGQACFTGPVQEEIFAGEDLAGKAVKTSTVDRIDFVPADGASPAPRPRLGALLDPLDRRGHGGEGRAPSDRGQHRRRRPHLSRREEGGGRLDRPRPEGPGRDRRLEGRQTRHRHGVLSRHARGRGPVRLRRPDARTRSRAPRPSPRWRAPPTSSS